MASYLSPGVYIEEITNAPQVVQPVGTSTMAIVGWTTQGPDNEATLCTSYNQYTTTFGPYSNESLVPITVSAFFQNGGTRCYVVRVVPTDSEAATSGITSAVVNESHGGAQAGTSPTTLNTTLTYIPVTSGSVTVNWTKTGTVRTAEAESWSPSPNGTLLGTFTATMTHAPATLDVITINWTETSVSKSATLTGTSTLGGTNAANVSSATVNRTTGVISITFAVGHPPDASSLTLTYTSVGAAATVTDSNGTFTASGVSGTIDYTTGAVSITWTGSTVVPYNGDIVTFDYTGVTWGLTAANPGVWGDGLQLTIAGDPNSFVYGPPSVSGAGSYGLFDLTVSLLDANDIYEVEETYSGVVFNSATAPSYFADVLNHGSAYITVTDYGFLNAPASFFGVSTLAEAVGSGNGSTKTFTYTLLNPPPVKTSLVVHYTISAVAYEATANVSGTISGTGIDGTKTNTINWTTGAITLNFLTAPDNSTSITADYVTMPTTTSVSYTFSGGSDGTISDIGETLVSNFTDLKSGKLGMYALDRVDEVMQLVIPDFTGNTSVMSDMSAYADDRGDLFCIFSTPSGMTAQEAADFNQITYNVKSKHAALYWPQVVVQDPTSSIRQLTIPAVGHIAGIYARTDTNRNVAKAPAGVVDGAILGIIGLEVNPDQSDRDTVYPARVNSLINTPSTGLAVWGARTLSPFTDATIYIQAVRLFEFVEKSILNSTQTYIFETISGNLYASIKGQISSFLLNLYNQGYLAGSNPSLAFQVICDSTNNPPAVVAQGQVIVQVGIAPTTPGEFLIIQVAQSAVT